MGSGYDVPPRSGTGAILDHVTGRPPLRSSVPEPPTVSASTVTEPTTTEPTTTEPTATEPTATEPTADEPTADEPTADGSAPAPAGVAGHRRPRRALVLVPLRLVGRGARATGRALLAWARRPSGRFVVPALAIGIVLGATATAGAYVVPRAAPAVPPSPPASPSTAPSAPDAGLADGLANPGLQDPNADPVPGGATPAATGRPQLAMAGWAQKLSPAVGISVPALEAYGYATLRTATDVPACHLSWTTLAAIGKVESDHGKEGGADLQPNGEVLPPIIGAALDGRNGVQLVPDSDGGTYDGDRTYDRAVGPMQFIPSTWTRYQVDADGDGQADPNNLNDAALAAANYLCAGGKDLATSGGWWAGVLSYNALQTYATKVFDAANDYGQRSRSVA